MISGEVLNRFQVLCLTTIGYIPFCHISWYFPEQPHRPDQILRLHTKAFSYAMHHLTQNTNIPLCISQLSDYLPFHILNSQVQLCKPWKDQKAFQSQRKIYRSLHKNQRLTVNVGKEKRMRKKFQLAHICQEDRLHMPQCFLYHLNKLNHQLKKVTQQTARWDFKAVRFPLLH